MTATDPTPVPLARQRTCTFYPVPLDVVLALPTGSIMRGLIQERRDRGDRPAPLAQVFAEDGQYFAAVDWQTPDRGQLVFMLDVWVWHGPAERKGSR